MSSATDAVPIYRWYGLVLVALFSGGLYWFTGQVLGPLLVVVSHLFLPFLLSALNRTTSPTLPYGLVALVASTTILIAVICIQWLATVNFGWRGFVFLSDITLSSWLHFLSLWPVILCAWLGAMVSVKTLRQVDISRQTRIVALVAASAVISIVGITPLVDLSIPFLFLAAAIVLIGIDFYLDSNRTSMTWLLVWLLLLSILTATFTFGRSLQIDEQARQSIASSIVVKGIPDAELAYHLNFGWDTLSYATAQARLSPTQLALSPGEVLTVQSERRSDLILHAAMSEQFIIVGRNTGGLQPPIALASLLFISGLLYILLLRTTSWLLRYPLEHWLLPIFGPSSLRLRIQLSIFAITSATFFLVGWFTIRFFSNEDGLLSNWLEQLLSVYAFLLLVVGALGIILANSITEPIVRIGQKLSATQLQDNEPLLWPKNDEIGRLVSNYNLMIKDLALSAQQLARSERESAWREMAKQVAHEIKNPLTPMKLQLQQLQRLEKEDPEKARRWSQRAAKNIIEQIDGMARIATAFSEFARLPEANNQLFSLSDLLQSVVALHQNNEQAAQVNLQTPTNDCLLYADRDQIQRVFNNLIRNALQALPEGQSGHIDVRLSSNEDHYNLSVMDNGSGIPDDIQKKIFQPNFTTKSSGMGLGLAMCRNIIEQAGGNMGFETKLGEGTTFWIHLPHATTSTD